MLMRAYCLRMGMSVHGRTVLCKRREQRYVKAIKRQIEERKVQKNADLKTTALTCANFKQQTDWYTMVYIHTHKLN